MKKRYAIREDGIYSAIVESEFGDFKTFSEAKKELLKYYRERMEDFRESLREAKKIRKQDIEKEIE